MPIFCFRHKLALIVNAGLAELGVKAPPPSKAKSAARGRFPTIGTIKEEDEELTPEDDETPQHDVDDVEDSTLSDVLPGAIDEENDWDIADAEDEVTPEVVLWEEVAPTHQRAANHVDFIFRKVLC